MLPKDKFILERKNMKKSNDLKKQWVSIVSCQVYAALKTKKGGDL